nr:unnamed protein product [Digitaria exilis]
MAPVRRSIAMLPRAEYGTVGRRPWCGGAAAVLFACACSADAMRWNSPSAHATAASEARKAGRTGLVAMMAVGKAGRHVALLRLLALSCWLS